MKICGCISSGFEPVERVTDTCTFESCQPRQCLNCNKELQHKIQKKFCSRSCAATINNRGMRRNFKSGLWSSDKRFCRGCGTIECTPGRVYCSLKCANSTPRKRRKDPRNNVKDLYYKRRKLQTPDNVNRAALREFYRNRPEGHEVDHIVPISKGGLHEVGNLQYLPKLENRKKGNRNNATVV